jgi:hypothetical protein
MGTEAEVKDKVMTRASLYGTTELYRQDVVRAL